METFPHTIDRLMSSLETLASAETVLLANEAWSELAVVQERSAIIVNRIVALMGEPGAAAQLDADHFDRALALTQEQGEKIAFLAKQSALYGEELRSLNKSQQNVRTMLSAYRAPMANSPNLSFAG